MKFQTLSLMPLISLSIILGACGPEKTVKSGPEDTKTNVRAVEPIDAAIQGSWRAEQANRDKYRHPKQTLAFFGLAPEQRVLEIFPGSAGWYTAILAPYLKQTGGSLTVAVFDPAMGEKYQKANERFLEKYSDESIFGTIKTVPFGPNSPALPSEQYDLILSFRNVHSWLGKGYGEKAFSDFYKALKPGGTLGIVEHRLPESAEQDPLAGPGYVQVSYTKDLAKAAGFEFVGASEINANPKDTADHPYGVWTLPPVSRKPKPDDEKAASFDADKYLAIGESDRYTLKFRKPD